MLNLLLREYLSYLNLESETKANISERNEIFDLAFVNEKCQVHRDVFHYHIWMSFRFSA